MDQHGTRRTMLNRPIELIIGRHNETNSGDNEIQILTYGGELGPIKTEVVEGFQVDWNQPLFQLDVFS